MKLSVQSLARKLSLPSPRRGKKDGSTSSKRGICRSEAPSFASTASSSSSSDEGALARSSAPSPRSVLLQPAQISRRELAAVLRRLGHGDLCDADLDDVAAIAAAQDAGGAGAGGDLGELMEAFRVFDADGDGRIDAEELRGVMVAILGADCSLDDCRRMIGGVDADGDGFVGFEDFARMMMITTTTDGATVHA